MIDLYNIEAHNKQLTPEEVANEARTNRRRCMWAVCSTIDHTAKGCQQDDHRDKINTSAVFEDPFSAENYINNVIPKENRERVYIVRLPQTTTNGEILESLSEIESALYYRLDGKDSAEGVNAEDLRTAHQAARALLEFWHKVTGETLRG